MSWIDSAIPQAPEIQTDPDGPTGKISFYLRQDTLNNMINRYVIYMFPKGKKMDKEDPKNISDIIISGEGYYSFDPKLIPSSADKVVLAVTALTSTNNESRLSNVIQMERKGAGWVVVN